MNRSEKIQRRKKRRIKGAICCIGIIVISGMWWNNLQYTNKTIYTVGLDILPGKYMLSRTSDDKEKYYIIGNKYDAGNINKLDDIHNIFIDIKLGDKLVTNCCINKIENAPDINPMANGYTSRSYIVGYNENEIKPGNYILKGMEEKSRYSLKDIDSLNDKTEHYLALGEKKEINLVKGQCIELSENIICSKE